MNRIQTTAIALTCVLQSYTVLAQTNSLVGAWQHSEPASTAGPAHTSLVTYYANETYELRFAVAPNPQTGQGSGVLVIRGRYNMTSPTSIVYYEETAALCPAGMECQPNPMPIPDFGKKKTLVFHYSGADRLVSDGVTWFRAQ